MRIRPSRNLRSAVKTATGRASCTWRSVTKRCPWAETVTLRSSILRSSPTGLLITSAWLAKKEETCGFRNPAKA